MAVFTDTTANGFELLLVGAFHGLDHRNLGAATFHCQLVEGVTGTGGRRRAEHFDFVRRQGRVDVFPGFVGVRDQGGAVSIRYILGQGQEDVLQGQLVRATLGRVGNHDTVEADLHFDDLFHAVGLAGVELRLLHAARSTGHVSVLGTHASAEQLHAAAGAGGLNLRGGKLAALAEALCHGGGERVNRGRTNDGNGVAGCCNGRGTGDGQYSCQAGKSGFQFHGI